ncbi:hypothetical protein SARC_17322, partial [Sphaeroforma arctica JP610]
NQFKQDEVSLQESSESGLDDNQDAFEEERYHHKAAVALSVGVGSYCDPVEIPGLAHFLFLRFRGVFTNAFRAVTTTYSLSVWV